jgi:hypothetical protein
VFRLSVIKKLERLKENTIDTVPEFIWNEWGKVGGTLPRKQVSGPQVLSGIDTWNT